MYVTEQYACSLWRAVHTSHSNSLGGGKGGRRVSLGGGKGGRGVLYKMDGNN